MIRARLLAGCLVLVGLAAVPAAARPAQPLGGEQPQLAAAAQQHGAGQRQLAAPAQQHAPEPTAEHGAGEHAGATLSELVYRWINFLLLAALLYWLLVVPPAFVTDNFEFPGLRLLLAERARGIVAARDLARRQLAEADENLSESEQRLARVEQEVSLLIGEAERAAAAERRRLEQAAIAEAERIREGAVRDLNAQIAAARRELQAHVAELTARIARSLLEREFGARDQDQLVRSYLDRLSRTVA